VASGSIWIDSPIRCAMSSIHEMGRENTALTILYLKKNESSMSDTVEQRRAFVCSCVCTAGLAPPLIVQLAKPPRQHIYISIYPLRLCGMCLESGNR
jgi:hypothetical protein